MKIKFILWHRNLANLNILGERKVNQKNWWHFWTQYIKWMRQDISKQTAIKGTEINKRKLIYFSYFLVMKINQKPHIKALLLLFTNISHSSTLFLFFFLFILPYFVCWVARKFFQQLRNNVTNSSVIMPFVLFVVRKWDGIQEI